MFRHLVLAVVLAVVGVACEGAGGGDVSPTHPPTPVRGFPSAMAALGDSLTAGFASCLAPAACPRNSWSTGSGARVNSHYRRILRENPAIRGHATNLAVPGATVADLLGQAATVAPPVGYVTILMGANDACRGAMTAPEEFRSRLDHALDALRVRVPQARILLVTLPDVYQVWELGRYNVLALGLWKTGICPNLLGNASSTAPADVARRAAFRSRVTAYNQEITAACAAYGPRCRRGDLAGLTFDLTMLSAVDFFHPNAAGQRELAERTYPGDFTW